MPVIGHFEALSRAKQFLGIITIKDRKDGFNYTTFKNQLSIREASNKKNSKMSDIYQFRTDPTPPRVRVT